MQVAEVEGVLYAMGGNDGSSSLNSVEVLPITMIIKHVNSVEVFPKTTILNDPFQSTRNDMIFFCNLRSGYSSPRYDMLYNIYIYFFSLI